MFKDLQAKAKKNSNTVQATLQKKSLSAHSIASSQSKKKRKKVKIQVTHLEQ